MRESTQEALADRPELGRHNEDWHTADVIVGGFPCQDISDAGGRTGIAGERSGLWKFICGAIRLVRPKYAIVENVAALLGRGMGTVLGDLAEVGYDAEWHCIPAAYIGARHIRDRTWIIAFPTGQRFHAEQNITPELFERYREPCATWGDNGFLPRSLARQTWTPPDFENDRISHGLPEWMDGLNALGNAVVPQIPEVIGRCLK